MSDLVGLNQLSRRLRLPAKWLKGQAEAGQIPCLRVEGRLLFSHQAVVQALTELAGSQREAVTSAS